MKPKSELPPCYIVDHIPGQSLLVSIKTGQKPKEDNNSMPNNDTAPHQPTATNTVKQENPTEPQPSQINNSVQIPGAPSVTMEQANNPQFPNNS